MKDVNLLINNGVDVNASLELFGDIDTYNETLEDFLNTVDEKIGNMTKYKEESDMKNYAILVHSLKSDARYLGFTKLAELSYNHEMQSKANNDIYVYDNYDELINETNRIIDLVREYLGKEKLTRENDVNEKHLDKKILVDSDIIRNLLKKMFNDEYEIITADDGQEALDIISKNNDLFGVLLDLNMPNVNGFAVLDYFKQNSLFSKIPVAIITGDDSKETIEKAFTYTIVDVLSKPFNEMNVRRVITSMENFK